MGNSVASSSHSLISLALLHEVAMVSPLVAIGALVVLTAVAESASIASYGDDSYGKSTSSDVSKQESHEDKYDNDYKMKKQVTFARTYKHEPQYYQEEYYRPIYQVYEVPKYDHRGANRHKPVSYGDGGEPHSYRQKRSSRSKAREERVLARWEAVYGSRDAPSECKCSAACLDVIPSFHRKLPAFGGL